MPIQSLGAEERIATKIAEKASGYFKRDAVTGVKPIEESKKVTKATAEELNEAIKAKFLPHTLEKNNLATEQLGKEYAIAHGNF